MNESSIGSKSIHPTKISAKVEQGDVGYEGCAMYTESKYKGGLTFREQLILQLATTRLVNPDINKNESAEMIINTADAIIETLDKE